MTKSVEQIVTAEWVLFGKVRNIGGAAHCQQDQKTFFIMRSSQLAAWSPAMRDSYYGDLLDASLEGRSLLSEKYAYMMARTHPAEYEALKRALPPHDAEKERLVDGICAAHVMWQEELAARYPHLTGQGRPIRRTADSTAVTSFETYLWGELQTYSRQTLEHYAAYVAQLQRENQSLGARILENMTAQYGYPSPAAAESALTAH